MKKWMKAGGAVLLLVTVSGCNSIDTTAVPSEAREIEEPNYDSAEKRHEFYHQFVDNLEQGKPDWIRITSHTAEGDPIINDVKFDGKIVELTADTSKDKFGKGEIIKFTCEPELTAEADEHGNTTYNFTDCNDRSEPATLFFENTKTDKQ